MDSADGGMLSNLVLGFGPVARYAVDCMTLHPGPVSSGHTTDWQSLLRSSGRGATALKDEIAGLQEV